MKYWLILFISLSLPSLANAERVRKVKMKRDQIVQVKTALGVATIIQVADQPTSLVVGDNEAFKVEFLEQAITIKPLHRNAKSNLYIYTEYRRFDVQLVTVSEGSADYVVYLENVVSPLKLKPVVEWKKSELKFKNGDLSIAVKRLGQSDLSLFVELEFSSASAFEVDPASLWVLQSKTTVPIHRLVLSSFKGSKANAIRGVVEILKDDLNLSKPFTLEIRRKTSTHVEIPRALGW
jgi:hypothetical protein